MITEEAYSPYFFKIKLDGKLTYEMKPGLRNDFMSGPFINYVLDEENDRVLFLEGFCYSPSKKNEIHQLESIIKSVSVLKSNCKLARV
jgi:hypothetical protein